MKLPGPAFIVRFTLEWPGLGWIGRCLRSNDSDDKNGANRRARPPCRAYLNDGMLRFRLDRHHHLVL